MSTSSSFDFEYPQIPTSPSLTDSLHRLDSLRLTTPPRLTLGPPPNFESGNQEERIVELEQQVSDLRLINAEERLKGQTEVVTLRSEVQLLRYQLETALAALVSKDEEISGHLNTAELLKEKQDLLYTELQETRAKKEPEEVFRLRTHVGQIAAERDALLAEVAATRAVLVADGISPIVIGIVKEREMEITKLRAVNAESAETVKLLENEVHDLRWAKRDVEQDLKLLLGQRQQLQTLKSQLVAIKENKQLLDAVPVNLL
jgi:hypothetical protein